MLSYPRPNSSDKQTPAPSSRKPRRSNPNPNPNPNTNPNPNPNSNPNFAHFSSSSPKTTQFGALGSAKSSEESGNCGENQRVFGFGEGKQRNFQNFVEKGAQSHQNGWKWRNCAHSVSNSRQSNGETSRFGGKSRSAVRSYHRSGDTDRIPNRKKVQSGGSGRGNFDVDSDDEDWMCSDEEYDSEPSDLSVETVKKSKWLRDFLKFLDSLSAEEMNSTNMKLHCPACRDGVGSITWYRGLQPILAHARTVTSKRVKLHRKFAVILEDELKRRGADLPVAEVFGKWKGLQRIKDEEIVWPPMVIIQNIRLDRNGNGKLLGMGKEDLLNYFEGYKAVDANNAYRPGGHCGTGVLIFESSVLGYLEAERLHKNFINEGRGKNEWENHGGWRYIDGNHGLYGYLATKEEMDTFNKHSIGKRKLKFDLRSHRMMVIDPLNKMNENHQKIIELETEVSGGHEFSKTFEETCENIGRNLCIRELEIETIKQRNTEQLQKY